MCSHSKLLSEFGVNKRYKDGRSLYCLECNRAKNKELRAKEHRIEKLKRHVERLLALPSADQDYVWLEFAKQRRARRAAASDVAETSESASH
jgi:hypothetical protein